MPERIGRIPQKKQVRKLEMDYYAAQKDIQRTLLSVNMSNYSELAAVSIQKKTDEQVRRLNREAIRWAKTAVPMAYEESYLIAKTRLEILGAKRDMSFNKKEHRNTVDEDIDITIDYLIKANQSIKINVAMYLYLIRQASLGIVQIQEYDFRDEAFLSSLLDDAIREGQTREYLRGLIMEHMKIETMEGQFIQIHGRNYNMRSYADLVAKTRLRHVQSEAVKNACAQFDNDLVEISSHGTDCTICLPYEGNVYSIGGKTKGYPYLEMWPPFHPRCQHHARPTSEIALTARQIFH